MENFNMGNDTRHLKVERVEKVCNHCGETFECGWTCKSKDRTMLTACDCPSCFEKYLYLHNAGLSRMLCDVLPEEVKSALALRKLVKKLV